MCSTKNTNTHLGFKPTYIHVVLARLSLPHQQVADTLATHWLLLDFWSFRPHCLPARFHLYVEAVATARCAGSALYPYGGAVNSGHPKLVKNNKTVQYQYKHICGNCGVVLEIHKTTMNIENVQQHMLFNTNTIRSHSKSIGHSSLIFICGFKRHNIDLLCGPNMKFKLFRLSEFYSVLLVDRTPIALPHPI